MMKKIKQKQINKKYEMTLKREKKKRKKSRKVSYLMEIRRCVNNTNIIV